MIRSISSLENLFLLNAENIFKYHKYDTYAKYIYLTEIKMTVAFKSEEIVK